MSFAAIPTMYAGVQFRSRLEARWAAFFDLCGDKWEYEPVDLHGWIPDFRLPDTFQTPLVEVKPASDLHALWQYVEKIERAVPPGPVFLLGERPFRRPACFGPNDEYEIDEATDWFFLERRIVDNHGPWKHPAWSYQRTSSGFWIADPAIPAHVPKDVLVQLEALPACTVDDIWKAAGNLVQWRSPRR